MKLGTPTGVMDEFFNQICVGDTVKDGAGRTYTVDRYGRANPTTGGDVVRLQDLGTLTIETSWREHADAISKAVKEKKEPEATAEKPAPEVPAEMSEEEKALHAIYEGVDNASDQMLVDKLRERGWTVTCTKRVEKIVYEEVSL